MTEIALVFMDHDVVLIDRDDLPLVLGYSWHVERKPNRRVAYAVAYAGTHNGKQKLVYMHRLVAQFADDVMVDHINRNGLDNRRSNLRPATEVQNHANASLSRANTSGYKGVNFHGKAGRWRASIGIRGRHKHIGYFDNAEEAARAYDEAAVAEYGEFACVNFPREGVAA